MINQQLNQFKRLAEMFLNYQTFIESIIKDQTYFNQFCRRSKADPFAFLTTLPSLFFIRPLLKDIEKLGFYKAISLFPGRLAIKLDELFAQDSSNKLQMEKVVHYVLAFIWPQAIMFDFKMPTQELLNRAKQIKKSWNLAKMDCGSGIIYFQLIFTQKEGQNYNKNKILNDLLILFDTNQRNLDYKVQGIRALNLAVGQLVYSVLNPTIRTNHCYADIVMRSKLSINTIFNKIKQKEATFGELLSYLTEPDNNASTFSRIKNILSLFVLVQIWEDFNNKDSGLHSQLVIQIIGEAFNRIFCFLYNESIKQAQIFIALLAASKFTLHQPIQKVLGYHLIALHKLYSKYNFTEICELIEQNWRQKMTNFMINQIYTVHNPPFLKNGQAIKSKTSQERQNSQIQFNSKKSNQTVSKQNYSSSKMKRLKSFRRYIQIQLKGLCFEKVFLLIANLKEIMSLEINSNDIQNISKSWCLGILLTIIKKCQSKAKYRFSSQFLIENIYLQSLSLFENYNCQGEFNYQQTINLFGSFQYCSFKNGQAGLGSMVNFQIHNSAEDSLQVLTNLKLIKRDLERDKLTFPEGFEEKISKKTFQRKIYELFKGDKFDAKRQYMRLTIVAKLLLLNSSNIHYNLLVNYVHYMLKYIQNDQPLLHKKKQILSHILIEQVVVRQEKDQERIRFLLKMAQILDTFDIQLDQKGSKKSSSSDEYFNLLRSPDHEFFYINLSLAYGNFNYLKESLYFLQLHHFASKKKDQPDKKLKCYAIQLYSRLSNNFRRNVPSIIKNQFNETIQHLVIEQDQINKEFKVYIKPLYKMVEIKLQGMTERDIKHRYYLPFLLSFIRNIYKFGESKEIHQQMLKCCIIIKILNIKVYNISNNNELKQKLDQICKVSQKLDRIQDQIEIIKFLSQQIQKAKPYFEEKYYQTLLKANDYKTLLISLREESKGDSELPIMKLKYLIRCLFQKKQYSEVLAMFKLLSEKGEQYEWQLLPLQFQCRYRKMLNQGLEDVLKFIKDKCLILSENKTNNYLKYFFKMFRLLFNRYIFRNPRQNELFLEMYLRFLQKLEVLNKSEDQAKEPIFYLFRFVIEKFNYYSQCTIYGHKIIDFFQKKMHLLVPHCDYLLRSYSVNKHRNLIIQTILKTVIVKNVKPCLWTISFLKHFNLPNNQKQTEKEQQKIERQKISELQKYVSSEISGKHLINSSHLQWIGLLVSLSNQHVTQRKKIINLIKTTEVPKQLPFVFQPDCFITQVVDVQPLDNGKSAPIQLSLKISRRNGHNGDRTFSFVKVILKNNHGCKRYRLQSNTANFFSQIGILNKAVTYRIYHLSKYTKLIEYVPHLGSLTKILTNYFPELKRYENMILNEMNERKIAGSNQRRSLNIYDKYKDQLKLPFSHFLYRNCRNIKEWWSRMNNFIQTHAQWSYLGYVIGLGDRHPDNILLTDDAKLIHIDFEFVLDGGFKVPFPEWVPFRLTACLIEPLGVLRQGGMFYAEMIATANELEEKQAEIWKALSNFVGSMDTNVTEEILERARFANLEGQSLEEGIWRLIQTAKNPQLLRLMFDGWRSYL